MPATGMPATGMTAVWEPPPNEGLGSTEWTPRRLILGIRHARGFSHRPERLADGPGRLDRFARGTHAPAVTSAPGMKL